MTLKLEFFTKIFNCFAKTTRDWNLQHTKVFSAYSSYKVDHNYQTLRLSIFNFYNKWYKDGAGNTVEKPSIFSLFWMHQQGQAAIKTLFQQNPPVHHHGYQLTQLSCKMAVKQWLSVCHQNQIIYKLCTLMYSVTVRNCFQYRILTVSSPRPHSSTRLVQTTITQQFGYGQD